MNFQQDLASQLMFECGDLIAADKLMQAESLVKAAFVLLDESGGRDNQTGIWLIFCQAAISDANGQPAKALNFYRQGKEKAKTVFGRDHVFTRICLVSYAGALAKAGHSRGISMLQKALALVRKAKPTKEVNFGLILQATHHAQEILKTELGSQDPLKSCDLYRKLYVGDTNGVHSADLSKKDPSLLIVTVASADCAVHQIPEEHRQIFKGLRVKIEVKRIPGSVVLHRRA